SKNKGLVAETFNWDKEEVFDDEDMTQVKVLMALADDELVVVKNHAKNDSKLPNFNTRRIMVPKSQAVNECLGLTKAPTDPESSKESKSKPITPLFPLKVLRGASLSSKVMPLTYQEHSTRERPGLGHNCVILVRGGVLAESSQSSKFSIGVIC
nr:retrovirus-related Pol polyprotein from transposon TNT 1-94 [Tanacetum cinerariifolium]